MFRSILSACALVGVLTIAAGIAWAQDPGRIRGEIVKADGAMLVLKTREGATVNVKVDDKTRVSALVKASLADIKTDSFIGIGGVPQADGSIQAFSVHIFLPAQRGVVPERTGPWDARPGSTMTNAVVSGIVNGKDGETLIVKYKDSEKKVTVTRDTAIAAAAKGDKNELKPGVQIIIFGWEKLPDGVVLAKTLYVGRGLTPAM